MRLSQKKKILCQMTEEAAALQLVEAFQAKDLLGCHKT